MNFPVVGTALGAFLALLLGLWLVRAGKGLRRRKGLGDGKTLSLDTMTLTSRRLRLTGRPDRLVKTDGTIIPEEWKSSLKVWPNHRVQMGVYFLLIEDQMHVKPPHGFIVCGDGSRHRIENDEPLRAWVLGLDAQIRAARKHVNQPITVNPRSGQCRNCGQRENCGQART